MNRRGQSTLEYAVLVAVVAAAAIGMQLYVKRGIQGRLRESADRVGDQYAPGKTTSTFNTTVNSSRTEDVFESGKSGTSNISEVTNRTGSESVTESFNASLF